MQMYKYITVFYDIMLQAVTANRPAVHQQAACYCTVRRVTTLTGYYEKPRMSVPFNLSSTRLFSHWCCPLQTWDQVQWLEVPLEPHWHPFGGHEGAIRGHWHHFFLDTSPLRHGNPAVAASCAPLSFVMRAVIRSQGISQI